MSLETCDAIFLDDEIIIIKYINYANSRKDYVSIDFFLYVFSYSRALRSLIKIF